MPMTDSKKLYFIPILAKAIGSDDPKRAMEDAFEEIRKLGQSQEYQEGFRQFQEFARHAIKHAIDDADPKTQPIKNTIHHLIYDLVTDNFGGDDGLKKKLLNAIQNNPEWNAEYERIIPIMEKFRPIIVVMLDFRFFIGPLFYLYLKSIFKPISKL